MAGAVCFRADDSDLIAHHSGQRHAYQDHRVLLMFPWQEAVGIIVFVIVVFFLVRVIKKNFKIVRVKE